MKLNAFRNAATLAFSVTFAGVVMAQSSSPQTTPPTPQGQERQGALAAMVGQTITVSGCLAEEKAVPGQTPNIAERAGVAPDYILTNVQVRSGAPTPGADKPGTPEPGAPRTPSRPGAPGEPPTTGSPTTAAPMPGAGNTKVKLKEVDNDEMRSNLNKRVEATGRLQAAQAPSTGVAGAAQEATRGAGPSEPLPELHVTNVRVLDQPCTPQQ